MKDKDQKRNRNNVAHTGRKKEEEAGLRGGNREENYQKKEKGGDFSWCLCLLNCENLDLPGYSTKNACQTAFK